MITALPAITHTIVRGLADATARISASSAAESASERRSAADAEVEAAVPAFRGPRAAELHEQRESAPQSAFMKRWPEQRAQAARLRDAVRERREVGRDEELASSR
jgi:hypothetical protein